MRLFLLRHAHTAKAKGGTTDFDRKIDKRGYDQLKVLNGFLSNEYEKISFQVFCSPAQRTKTTYEAIESSINIAKIEYDHKLYLPSRDDLLKFLWDSQQIANDVLVVSHNNGISDLASYLLNDTISLPTCGLLVINFEGIESISEISKGLGFLEQSCSPT